MNFEMETMHIITPSEVFKVKCYPKPGRYDGGEQFIVETYNDRKKIINSSIVRLSLRILHTDYLSLYTYISHETNKCLFAVRAARIFSSGGVDEGGIIQVTLDNFKNLMYEDASDDMIEWKLIPLIYRFFKKYPLEFISPLDLFVSTNFDLENIIDRLDYLEQRGILRSTADQRGYPYHLEDGGMDKLEELIRASTKETEIENRYFKKVNMSIDMSRPFAFVLMPFKDEEFKQSHYFDVIKPTIENELKLKCIRSDEIADPGVINNQIYTGIAKAKVVIAEVTTQNLNVFYEMGLAHALDKSVFIFKRKDGEKLPFDISSVRAINYMGEEDLKQKLISNISKHIIDK